MEKIGLCSFLALALLAACSEDSSSKKSGVVRGPSTSIVRRSIPIRRSIPKDVNVKDVKPPAGAPTNKPVKSLAKKPSQFIYTKARCNIRRGPGTRYPITRRVTKGEKLEYIYLKGNWYKLKVAKGKPQEWVHKSIVVLPKKF